MYEFIYFLQLSCMNSYIFAVQNKSCERAQAASVHCEHAAQAASARRERAAWAVRAKPKLTSCPDQAAPDLCRSDPIYQSKTICEHKNVSYEAHFWPIIVKVQRAPNAQATLQIVNRHYEELKSSRPDSQTLKKAF